ncbi:MAG: hypothetical protein WC455_15695 [Dehalococcoidia bacterium]|jgi:hypothetical protein
MIRISTEPGYLVFSDENGKGATKFSIAEVLRAADIPTGLTHEQVGAITTLANLVVVLIRTLIDRQVLDESFLENDDLDLDHIIGAIEEMGGDYADPDISVT